MWNDYRARQEQPFKPDLERADLTEANLTGDLTGAWERSANLYRAKLERVRFPNVPAAGECPSTPMMLVQESKRAPT